MNAAQAGLQAGPTAEPEGLRKSMMKISRDISQVFTQSSALSY
jgi:hypothetical protein